MFQCLNMSIFISFVIASPRIRNKLQNVFVSYFEHSPHYQISLRYSRKTRFKVQEAKSTSLPFRNPDSLEAIPQGQDDSANFVRLHEFLQLFVRVFWCRLTMWFHKTLVYLNFNYRRNIQFDNTTARGLKKYYKRGPIEIHFDDLLWRVLSYSRLSRQQDRKENKALQLLLLG